ncbi:MAG: cell division topological specificity factor MinE [Helicobacteraceae bacterium]|jgi:cell division topological specificity factor|nr:cell division topological specificity factor MinE [Helicobacteraceae bacterium]
MNFFGLFKAKKSSTIAKDRLLIMISQERAKTSFDFLDQMRDDILEVIKRYTKVSDVRISAKKNQNIDCLEIEVYLENNK